MSYGKKDEDADLGLVKVDRTQVFQEGTNSPANAASASFSSPHRARWPDDANSEAQQLDCSTARQSSPDDAAFC
jgi:hypothetical protein